MNSSFMTSLTLGSLLALSLGLSSCTKKNEQAESPQTLVTVDGSSTVFPITEAIAEEFQKSTKGKIRVTVGISGTGGGFKKFCRGETDVQGASRPISKVEMEACKEAGVTYIELPVAYDATTVVVSPKNTWLKSITAEQLKKIWEPGSQGKIMKWNQIDPSWPDQALTLYGAGADSGTFDYFTEAIVGHAKSSRGDYTASEDDNTIVLGVSNDPNALGYLPYAYYEPNQEKLRAVPVDGGKKAPKPGPVSPSKQSVEDGSYYPLARPIFIYVSANAMKKAEVKEFAEYYLKNAPNLVAQVKYVSLPAAAYEMGLKNLSSNKIGTVFGGEAQVGLSIEELLKREAKL